MGYNPYPNMDYTGTDFFTEFKSPAIDFACIHMWHDQWLRHLPEQEKTLPKRLASAKKWIAGHEKACRTVLNKPLVIEEYGSFKGPDKQPERIALFKQVRANCSLSRWTVSVPPCCVSALPPTVPVLCYGKAIPSKFCRGSSSLLASS